MLKFEEVGNILYLIYTALKLRTIHTDDRETQFCIVTGNGQGHEHTKF